MRVIKHNPATPDPIVKVQDFTVGVPAYWISDGLNDTRLASGDYILIDDLGGIIYVSASNYAADNFVKQMVREWIGKEAARTAWKTLQDSALSNAQKQGILQTVNVTFTALLLGQVQEARNLANATATDTNYTAGVKTAYLGILDNAIQKL